MGIAFHKKSNNKYIQYTIRIKENILEEIRKISEKENLSINEVFNQSLEFAINDYNQSKK